MRYIKYYLDIGYAGCDDEGIIIDAHDMNDAEIDEMVNDMAHDWADSWEGDERLCFGNEDEDQEEVTADFRAGVSGWWEEATQDDLEEYGLA